MYDGYCATVVCITLLNSCTNWLVGSRYLQLVFDRPISVDFFFSFFRKTSVAQHNYRIFQFHHLKISIDFGFGNYRFTNWINSTLSVTRLSFSLFTLIFIVRLIIIGTHIHKNTHALHRIFFIDFTESGWSWCYTVRDLSARRSQQRLDKSIWQ